MYTEWEGSKQTQLTEVSTSQRRQLNPAACKLQQSQFLHSRAEGCFQQVHFYKIFYHFLALWRRNMTYCKDTWPGVRAVGNKLWFWSIKAWQCHKDRTALTCQQGWKFITANVLLSFFLVFKGFLNSKVTENCWEESQAEKMFPKGRIFV